MSRRELHQLIVSVFDAREFRELVRLVGEEAGIGNLESNVLGPAGNPLAAIASQGVATLERRDLLDLRFFALFARERPGRFEQIAHVAASFGVVELPRPEQVLREGIDQAGDVHLVLAAGGVTTACSIGALEVLEQAGIRAKGVAGTSAGSVMGLMWARGMCSQELQDRLFRPEFADAFKDRTWGPWFLRWPFAKIGRLPTAAIVEAIGGDARLGDLPIPFATCALDLAGRRLVCWSSLTTPEKRLSEIVEPALAVPGQFHPVEREGRVLVDGAAFSRAPSFLADLLGDPAPVLCVGPDVPERDGSGGLRGFIADVFNAVAIGGDALDRQRRKARFVEIGIHAHDAYDFGISREEQLRLVEAGRRKMGDELGDVRRWLEDA